MRQSCLEIHSRFTYVFCKKHVQLDLSAVLRACALYTAVAQSTVIPMVWRACDSQTSVSVAFGAHLRPAPRSDAAREGKIGRDEGRAGRSDEGRTGRREEEIEGDMKEGLRKCCRRSLCCDYVMCVARFHVL